MKKISCGFAAAFAACVLSVAVPAVAGPVATGSLDATFGTAGLVRAQSVTVSRTLGSGEARALVVQPDGRIVAAGRDRSGPSIDLSASIMLARFNADGTLDATFGAGSGIVTGDPGIANAIARDASGRIVVAGTWFSSFDSSGVILARFHADGTPDTSFGGTGHVLTNFTGTRDSADALAIDAAGRIVVAGARGEQTATMFTFGVARYNEDGSRDTTFGGTGVVLNGFGATFARAKAVAIDTLGRIVVGGWSHPEGFAVARYLADGTPDTGFGGTGSVVVPPTGTPSGVVNVGAMAMDGAGRIVLAGTTALDIVLPIRLVRLNADGSRDSGFGVDGIASDNAGQAIGGLAIDAGGRLVVAGTATDGTGKNAIVARYLANGARDASFASGGVTLIADPAIDEEAFGVVLDATGRPTWAGGYGGKLAVGRVLPDGGIDATFGPGGVAVAAPTITEQREIAGWRSIVRQGDGKIVSAGPVSESLVLARYNADGTPDTTFGSSGSVVASHAGFAFDGEALAIDAGGRIVVAGARSVPVAALGIARFNPDGSPDTTLGGTGMVAIPSGSPVIPAALAIDAGGRIVVAGGSSNQFVLARLNADGSPDATFGAGGGFVAPGAIQSGSARALAFDTAGRIVAAGGGWGTVTVARFGTDGTLDATFGGTGWVAVSGSLVPGAATDVAIDTDGRILVAAGYGGSAYEGFYYLARLLANGAPDTAFGNAGSGGLRTGVASGRGAAAAIDLDAAGRILVAGTANNGVIVTRVGTDGTADETFGGAGGVGMPFYEGYIGSVGLIVQPDGRILLSALSQGKAAIARLLAEPAPGTAELYVKKAGAGTGVVVSSPAGIDCGATCAASFTSGMPVTLAATPGAGQFFSGWSGACTGTGDCVLTLDASKAVTATFAPATSIPRLGNLSTRGPVLTGDNVLIGGFIIGGSSPKTVLVRARGPSMAAAGVAFPMANPQLMLVDQATATVITTNDNWGDAVNAAAITATGKAPTSVLESAILVTLSPGAYTAIVSGVGITTGTGIVEVFEIDEPAVPLANISTRGRVLTGDDVMIGGFVITGGSPKTVLIRARGPSMVSAGVTDPLANPQVVLVNSSQAIVATNDDWGSALNAAAISATGLAPTNSLESAILITLNPGAYTAVVSGVGGGTGVGIVEVFAQ